MWQFLRHRAVPTVLQRGGMGLLSVLIPKVKRECIKCRYYRAACKFRSTQPVVQGKLPFILLSVGQKRDAIPYLVAVRSFARHANPQRVATICSRSIDRRNRKTFCACTLQIELRDAIEFTDPRIPKAGKLERLSAIAGYASESCIRQTDSDNAKVNSVPEAVEAVISGTAFVLGGGPNEGPLALVQTFEQAKAIEVSWGKTQELADIKMAELDRPADEKYVRSCSGSTGFPRSADMLLKLFAYSVEMRHLAGDRWAEWGTEQVTSNYLVANSQGVKILPLRKYGKPNYATSEMAFFHFIGYTRYVDDMYESTPRQIIQALSAVSV